jgi:hypothetical protein
MRRLVLLSTLGFLASGPVFAQTGQSTDKDARFIRAYEKVILEDLSPQTRTEVQRRATGGNSVFEVARVTLLNNMSASGMIKPGEPPLKDVVAIDFIRENAVFTQGDNLRVMPFDRHTLTFRKNGNDQ